MKKAVFRQQYATDGNVTIIGKIEETNIEVNNEPEVIEENEKKEVKKKNGRKFTI